jgi:hypothetical protein|nr:MAG TPA: hypothetical protein [Bacteriophage sp.]
MTRSFTYDGAQIADSGINQMRFELGDVLVEEPDKTALLTDEEITAMIAAFPQSWRRAKFELIKSVLYRFAPEVDTKSGPVQWSLSQRYAQWKAIYEELKKELSVIGSLPELPGAHHRPPYFFEGMHDNEQGRGRLPCT